MYCEHKLMTHCRCPVDQRCDYYEVIVSCDDTIYVEKIEEVVESFRDSEMTQEALTQAIHRKIGLPCEVQTIGQHGKYTGTRVTKQ